MWLLIKHEVFTSSVALLCTSAALSFDTLVTESILCGPEHNRIQKCKGKLERAPPILRDCYSFSLNCIFSELGEIKYKYKCK